MKNKYYNDAIIGNKNMVVSFSKKGELLRLFYPTTDYKQFVDFLHTGVKVNDSNLIYLHNDINNTYNQSFIDKTNVLNTEIKNTYFNIKIKQTDFVSIKENVVIKKYIVKNENRIDLDINFVVHSKLNTNVSGYYKDNTLMQYDHDYTYCIFSKTKTLSYQINGNEENIQTGEIGGKDYVGMSKDSSISYNLGVLKPGEEKTLEIFIYINNNKETSNIDSIMQKVDKYRKLDVKVELENAKKYWRNFVKAHQIFEQPEGQKEVYSKIEEIYNRSILLFPLLTNSETGGISAAVEIDEEKSKCGGYSYCWPRDAIFITKALDICKMEEVSEKFYKTFCKNTQLKNGMWEQRYYTDGSFAPAWGYQIDETASIVYGIWEHYKVTKDKKFLKDTLKMCEKAIGFLEEYVEQIMTCRVELRSSYDLWEMFEGIHTYSLAAIFGAFSSMLCIYKEIADEYKSNRIKMQNIRKQEDLLEKYRIEIKGYVIKNLYDNEQKTFVRNNDDKKIDISLLGLITPFKMFDHGETKTKNTLQKIDLSLRTYTGGYKRFEDDWYMGGNPWPIANLWKALYHIEKGEKDKAWECFNFVLQTASEHGYIAEQIDNTTLTPAWVIGLGWSHAMFVIVLNELMK